MALWALGTLLDSVTSHLVKGPVKNRLDAFNLGGALYTIFRPFELIVWTDHFETAQLDLNSLR
jgi:hypothetical protein